MSRVLIEESTLTGMADLIRESKGTTDLIDPANFTSEFRKIVENSSSSSVEGGFTVRFFDENDELLQVTTVKSGMQIDTPIYSVSVWNDSSGLICTFPLTITADMDISPCTDTLSDSLYSFYNVDRQVYPYVFVRIDGYNYSTNRIGIVFCEKLSISGTTLYFADGAYVGLYNSSSYYNNPIKTSMEENPTALEAVQYCMLNISSIGENAVNYQYIDHAIYAVYTNKKDLVNEQATEIIYFD